MPTTDQNNPTERLIAEPLCVRLAIDRTSAQAVTSGNNVAALAPRATSLPLEAKRIVDALRAICASPEDTIVMWCGRPHKFVRPHHANPTKGTQLIGRPGAERAAQIVLAPDDERKKNQHIFTKFAVVPNGKPAPGKPPFFLECEGNPTTLMTGNNVLPVTSRNPKTKAVERYPSSAHNVMTTLNRLLFRFLEDIATQIPGSDAGLFEPESRQAIESGDFAIVHIQWCCYLRADVSRFLQVLSALFYPRGATEVGFSSLARQMGLRFDDEIDERSTRVTAVKFEKRHGKNGAFSVTFYNKRTRVGQMRQGKTLDPDEEELIDNNVRFDMTAHAIGTMRIIEAARNFLREHRELFTQLPETQWPNDFLSKNPQPTARWLEFAVFILSHRIVQGSMRRGSFAGYLVPLFLDDVLNLRSIVCCSVEGLRALETLKHPVAKAWREDKSYETRGWAIRLANAAGYRSDTVVYQCQDKWLATYGVNIEIPRAYYRDFRLHTAISLLQHKDRETYQSARDQGDGEKRLRVLDKADENLFAQMREFVGSAIQNTPTLLRAKVMGEVKAIARQPTKAVPADGVPTRRFGARPKVLPPPSGDPSAPGPLGSSASKSSGGGSPPVDETAGATLPKNPGPSSVPLTRRRLMLGPKPSILPYGVDRKSSRQKLFLALRVVREQQREQDLTEDEYFRLVDQAEELGDLIERKKDIIRRQQETRHENKKANRLKRMGGLPPLPRKPPQPGKSGEHSPKK